MTTQERVIKLTPTWEATANMLSVIMENGNMDGKFKAREEIRRMGSVLDAVLEERKHHDSTINDLNGLIKRMQHRIDELEGSKPRN